MALDEYRRKRDFKKTSEPVAKMKKGARFRKPIFVVQEHHASRLHYDFRLEHEGVLKSWAVTKEPVLDSSVKRLAVEVEDHPVDYAGFKGDIPEGEYGAGRVEIWDEGTYEPAGNFAEGFERGKLEFVLRGKKLKGGFVLVRMSGGGRKANWLLIKRKDEHARLPRATIEAPVRERSGPRLVRPSNVSPLVFARRLPRHIELTNEDKLWFPEAGVTKGEVFHYYEQVAEELLPYLRGRPITLERMPNGVRGPRFWQKNTPAHYPDWIPRVMIASETGKPVRYALVNDVETLLYLVNQGAITFHPFLSTIESLDCPDFVLFDLDPGEASFRDVMKVAKTLREILAEREIEATVKTSGKSGLHVLTPWSEEGGFEAARDWAMHVAKDVVVSLPGLATVERRIAPRGNRVYVDVIQNARGHHAVPPYVVRATELATVSAPLAWEELKASLSPEWFTVRTMLKRLGLAEAGQQHARKSRKKSA